jgi:hypothetical protein
MKLTKLLCVCIFVCVFSNIILAQTAPNPDVILARCSQAMGAPEASLSVIAEGQVQDEGSDHSDNVRIKTRGISDFRHERDVNGQAVVSIVSKGKGWHGTQEHQTAMSPHATMNFLPDHIPALACSTPPAQRGLRVTYVGSEEINATPVFHLKLDISPGGKNKRVDAIASLVSEYHIFIDQQSYRVVKTSKFVFAPDALQNRSLWETTYSDYRSVNGVQMPFHIENFIASRKFSASVFTTIQTGVALPDSDFQEVK